ncbi:P-loop containing nucleoside triphosphate hydrolase protein [Syncephalastrum racemosum]|uniref:P-loop containing nucleoside triphosphate hydrolase protein n=1 Tax=Syncephalastrum racemosum TaxID=13706 RepID=A0A1X2H7Y7_SYNRA|nr:P-loop containing nucleoside triphosphate hydrolase protein [Syncephalastrum racemosum]
MSGNNIKVVCRFRPQNSLEIREGGTPIIDIDSEGTQLELKGKEFKGNFNFDKVFGMNTPQKDVFDYSIKTIVDDVTAGYNGTVFAYGQTGSGKTFTMMGADIDDEKTKGIIPRIVEQIFDSIMASPSNLEFTVKVSYMEIYMEKVRDLLNPSSENLPIHEDKTKGVYVKGLLEVYVGSTDEVYEVMRRGSNNRVVAYTSKWCLFFSLSCDLRFFLTFRAASNRHECREFQKSLYRHVHNYSKERRYRCSQKWQALPR